MPKPTLKTPWRRNVMTDLLMWEEEGKTKEVAFLGEQIIGWVNLNHYHPSGAWNAIINYGWVGQTKISGTRTKAKEEVENKFKSDVQFWIRAFKANGYVLVPEIYKAMLAAAPRPEGEG